MCITFYWSAWTAITEHHRLSGLTAVYFLTVLEAGSPKMRMAMWSDLLREGVLPGWQTVTFLLSLHMVERALVFLPLCMGAPVLWDENWSTLITSFNFNHSLKAYLQYILDWRIPQRRSLVGYSPWGCKESDTTERLTLSLFTIFASLVLDT